MYKKKTGIMGGTFDPIHKGHLYLAECALNNTDIDEILWIPNCIAYLKESRVKVSPQMRYDMVLLAIKEDPRYIISDIEIKRGGNSYTHETLEELALSSPNTEFYFLTGADTLYTIESWVNPAAVFASSRILAAYRSGQSLSDLKEQIRHLKDKYNAVIDLIATDPVDISSTQIRNIIKEGGDASPYLPPLVYDYIKEKGLYK